MPIATAKWLVKNTGLTFKQIANFCNLHILEVQGIADNEIQRHVKELNPVNRGLLTEEEIEKCNNNPNLDLKPNQFYDMRKIIKPPKKYVSLAVRRDKQNGICWVLVNYPNVDLIKLIKLFKTTKTAIKNIKDKFHNDIEIAPRNPIELNLCSEEQLKNLLSED